MPSHKNPARGWECANESDIPITVALKGLRQLNQITVRAVEGGEA